VSEYGGRIALIPFEGGHSTTGLIDRIRTAQATPNLGGRA
jgi:bifunctional ADP-heptose synthase (sugar kinase/adenylyltransferase)